MIERILATASIALFVMTMALIFLIATLLLLKALLLERRSDFGRAIGRNNLAMSLAYYSVFFGIWIPFLTHPVVKFVIVVVTSCTATAAIRQLSIVYGGWRAMLVEAGEATAELVVEFRRVPGDMCRKVRALFARIGGLTRKKR